jgi:aryl-alcohol dehydrogenase-like predicted oxidoreductase
MLVAGAEPQHAGRLVAEAVERGVNYFDVAPTYMDAEQVLGPALAPYRRNVFLACKTTERQRAAAEAELRQSLQRLRTDYLDLYQLHALTEVEKDVDAAFAKGGAMEVLIEGRRAGRIRHLGFSAHSVAAALAALERFDFDSVLFPLNFVMYYRGDFGPQIVEQAQARGVTRLALKALARQPWRDADPRRQTYAKCWYEPLTVQREAELGLRFTLSQPITAAIPPGDETLFRLALDVAADFKPITAAELTELQALAATLAPLFQQ